MTIPGFITGTLRNDDATIVQIARAHIVHYYGQWDAHEVCIGTDVITVVGTLRLSTFPHKIDDMLSAR